MTIAPNTVHLVRVDGSLRAEEKITDAYGYIFCYLLIGRLEIFPILYLIRSIKVR